MQNIYLDCLQHLRWLMLWCQVALTVVIHIGDCENITKIPFNSPCTRCYTCTLTHRCKHSSVLSVNDGSRGTLKGPEARSGTAPQIPAPADRSFQQMMVNETQRRPAWRCGLEPLEVKHSYRLFQSCICAFTCATNTFWFKTQELLTLQTQTNPFHLQ